jgi:hypothetical protein
MKVLKSEETLAVAAAKAGMDEKTARKYRDAGRLPSQLAVEHTWRTRPDPFAAVWPEVEELLDTNAGFEAKSLLEYLQRQQPGRFADGQLRTLQRRVKVWRALKGPAKETFFPQRHHPGALCQSDFTDMTELGVTIAGSPFAHLLYHFVLTYSNWETASVCFSECFEALSGGFQDALWQLGGVPQGHQTDCLSAAVHKLEHPDDFTPRYEALMRHYGMAARKTNPHSPHENGDVEQRHHRLAKAVEQSLLLRGSRDFADRAEYQVFLAKLLDQLNAGRREKLAEELALLRPLPLRRVEDYKCLDVRVSRFSTIHVSHNTYSVHSRLNGEQVRVRLYADHLEVYYAQRQLESMPRLRGRGGHYIQYRHIIDQLVRKPGAFANYQYRDDLFPTTRFRLAYDTLRECYPEATASREYLLILELAAKESESQVEAVLQHLSDGGEVLSAARVKELLPQIGRDGYAVPAVSVPRVNLQVYDGLLSSSWVEAVAS